MIPLEAGSIYIGLLKYKEEITTCIDRLVRDPEDAADITQDVFVQAHAKLPETLARGNFQGKAWLYRMAINLSISELRRRKVISFVPIGQMDPEGDIETTQGDPVLAAEQSETKEEVQRVLAKLSERHRAVLILSHFFQLNRQEIAEVMRIPLGTAKNIIGRANEAFRFHYVKTHPQLAAASTAPRVYPRSMGRTPHPLLSQAGKKVTSLRWSSSTITSSPEE